MYCYELDEKNKNNVFCGLSGINHGVCSTAEVTDYTLVWLYKPKRSRKCMV